MAIATLVDIINLLKENGTDSLINLNELKDAVGRNSTVIEEVRSTLEQTRGELVTISGTTQAVLAQATLNSRALQETNTTVSDLQTEVSTGLSQHTDAIQALNARVASLESSLAGFAGLSERVASLENAVSGLNQRMTDCESKADQALTKGTALEERLNMFTSDVNAKLANLDTSMEALSQEWLDLGTRVTKLESKVNQHGLTLSSNSSSLSSLVNQLSGLETNVNQHGLTITSNANSISSLVTKLNGLETSNTSVTRDIAGIRNDMINMNNSIEYQASSLGSTQGNVATLLEKQSSIISAINLIKGDPVVRLGSVWPLDGNGFSRINLPEYFNSNKPFYGALNDNILGVIPYDIRINGSSDQYRTLTGTWADFENDSVINARVVTDLGGTATTSNGRCRVFMLTKSAAADVVI